jgi:hypothetical protein
MGVHGQGAAGCNNDRIRIHDTVDSFDHFKVGALAEQQGGLRLRLIPSSIRNWFPVSATE